jgi:hypothetical protein
MGMLLMALAVGTSAGCGQQSGEKTRLPSLIDEASNPIPTPRDKKQDSRQDSPAGEHVVTK